MVVHFGLGLRKRRSTRAGAYQERIDPRDVSVSVGLRMMHGGGGGLSNGNSPFLLAFG